jgi:hypothetical protein
MSKIMAALSLSQHQRPPMPVAYRHSHPLGHPGDFKNPNAPPEMMNMPHMMQPPMHFQQFPGMPPFPMHPMMHPHEMPPHMHPQNMSSMPPHMPPMPPHVPPMHLMPPPEMMMHPEMHHRPPMFQFRPQMFPVMMPPRPDSDPNDPQ